MIESKLFTLVKEGGSVRITERGWKRKQELLVEKSTTQWLVKLDVCSSGVKQDFYSTIREGYRSYLAQKCSNNRGCYLVVLEYREGGRRSFVLIPEGKEGRGWKRMKETLGVCRRGV